MTGGQEGAAPTSAPRTRSAVSEILSLSVTRDKFASGGLPLAPRDVGIITLTPRGCHEPGASTPRRVTVQAQRTFQKCRPRRPECFQDECHRSERTILFFTYDNLKIEETVHGVGTLTIRALFYTFYFNL